MNSLSAQEIEVVVSKEEYFIPESVIFSTMFTFKDNVDIEQKVDKSNKKFLDFIESAKLNYRLIQMRMSSSDVEYICPSYQITLNHDQYILLEEYKNNNPELGGLVRESQFSKKDKDKVLSDLTIQAWREADEIAIKKGLVLKNEYNSEEIVARPGKWIIGPPLSASHDHFRQSLAATYKFIFKTL